MSDDNTTLRTRVGPYELHELLGKGGMGDVWRARDTRLSRSVALKIMRTDDPEEVRRFAREAEIAAGLAHPNIATIHEVGVFHGKHFIAMQLVDGRTAQRLRAVPRETARIVRDAARAVHYAHEHGVIHRDLKPANVMVDRDGRVFVMDFGLARPVKADSSLTLSGALVGTPAYMSPEQARADLRAVDARSDVYSLGATLYEMLSGHAPFSSDDLISLLTQVVNNDPPSLRRTARGLPRDLETIATKCLEKDPARRYATAAALGDDLTRFLDGEPILAHPPSTLYRLRKRLAKHRGVALALAAALVAIGVLIGLLVPPLLKRGQAIAVREALRPLEETIRDARPSLYMAGADVTSRLRLVEAAVAKAELIEPKDADVWLTIGLGRHFIGDYDRAERALARASELRPLDPRVNYALGRLLLARGTILTMADFAELGADGRKPVAPDTQRGLETLRRAADHLGRLGADAPLREVDRAILRASTDLARGDDHGAGRTAENALRTLQGETGAEELWLLLGLVAVEKQKLDAYGAALRMRPNYDFALLLRAAVLESQGERDAALRDLSRAIQVNPRLMPAWVNRGVLRAAEDVDGAIADLSEAQRLSPDAGPIYVTRASLHLRRKDWQASIADAEQAIRLIPTQGYGYRARSRARRGEGDLDGALADAELALSLSLDAESYLLRSVTRSAAGDRDGALADADRAVEAGPRSCEARFHRGDLRSARGDRKGAMEDFSEALVLDRTRADLWYNRALARHELGDFDGAIADHTEAIQLKPGFALAWGNRACSRTSKGDADAALSDFEEALRLDPAYGDAYFNRAVLRLQRGELDAALGDLNETVRLKPAFPDAYGARGQVMHNRGDAAAAIADYERALRLAPADWPHRAQVEKLLAVARKP